MNLIHTFQKSVPIQLLLILIVTILVYSNIFSNQFVWDDTSFIYQWNQPKQLSQQWINLLAGDLPPSQLGVYRPVRSFIYALDFKLWHYNPAGYHFQSLIIHLSATILVYLIVQLITDSPQVSFLTSLFFATHPLHVEAITWVTASHDTIGLVFYLASFYFYLLAQTSLDHSSVAATTNIISTTKQVTTSILKNKKIIYLISIIFALLATFTYELTLPLPLLILIHQFILKQKSLLQSIHASKTYIAITLIFLIIRFGFLHIPTRNYLILNNLWISILTSFVSLVKYLQLTLIPIPLSVNHRLLPGIYAFFHHDFHSSIAIHTPMIFQPQIFLAIATVISLLVLTFSLKSRLPIISFSIAWFIISLLPVLNFLPTAILFAERYTYLALIGPMLILSVLLNQLIQSFKTSYAKLATLIIVLSLIVFYSFQTYSRNYVWQTPLSFWSHAAQSSPTSSFVQNNLAKAYSDIGDIENATTHNQLAVKLNPNSETAWANLAFLNAQAGNSNQAIKNYQKAISLKPSYYQAYIKLGDIYSQQGKYKTAISQYQKAIQIYPYAISAYINASSSYLNFNQPDHAIELLNQAQRIAPNQPSIYQAKVYIYLSQNNPDLARQILTQALKNTSNDPSILELIELLNQYELQN